MARTTLWISLLTLMMARSSVQVPIFDKNDFFTTSEFKGLPRLADVNVTAGEERVVYYHDQIVGVVDVLKPKTILRCELIEVYERSEADAVLKNLTTQSLKPKTVSFKSMLKLMDQCDKLDDNQHRLASKEKSIGNFDVWLVKFGIVPGTKWCGTGDVAKSYHDLGQSAEVDRCCRAHDLCPVKIRSYKSRYNLDNVAVYSRSHCACDEAFYGCLKKINQFFATLIGNLYFNVARPPCIEEDPTADDGNIKRFVPLKKAF